MFFEKSKRVVLHIVTMAVFCVGLSPASFAGAIDTNYMIENDARSSSTARIQLLLTQANVAEQLQKFGVDQSVIDERLQGMTTAELATLEQRLNSDIAAGSVVGIVGATFLVLIILELVGVTDIFKAF